MKIAYLFSRYPVPSQTFCDTEMRALEALGFEIEIYSCSPPATSFRHGAETRPRAAVFYAPPRGALELWEASARRAGRWPEKMIAAHAARHGPKYDPARRALHALYFADLARRRGVERLHIHFANRATHAALFMAELGAPPFSFTAHAQDFLIDLGSDALLAEMCARAAFVVAVSDWSRDVLARRCPDSAHKIHRIHNGLPLDQWPAPSFPSSASVALSPFLPSASAPAPSAFKIFSIGRLIEFKGFDDLIAACAELRRRGVPFQCEIAGEGPMRADLERLIAAHHLQDGVHLLGLVPQTQIRERLERCDAFALACRVDARGACDVLPTVILEAMAAARPVVSAAVAGVPEMVADGQTGRLVAPGDVPALADALAGLAADPALRARLGQAGREKLRAQFSADDSARQLARLFRETSAPPHAAAAAPLAAAARPPKEGDGVVCLFAQWPLEPTQNDAASPLPLWHEALLRLRARLPGLRLVALQCPAKLASPAAREGAAAHVEEMLFLPDAMVLEAEWREQAQLAHRLEAWRGELGGAAETGHFLREARRALYIHARIARMQAENSADHLPRHVCAVGGGALLCAYLLTRLDSARRGASFLAEAPSEGGLTGSTLRKLAPVFAGGWIAGERKLAAALGSTYRGDDLPASAEILATRLAASLQMWVSLRRPEESGRRKAED